MENLNINSEKAEIIRLSNDAYMCIKFGEPCLDDSNLREVSSIKEKYFGFSFGQAKFIDGGLVECEVTKPCSEHAFTHYRLEGAHCKSEFCYNDDKSEVHYRFCNRASGKIVDYGWNKVVMKEPGKPAIMPEGCLFPLWGNSWLKY